MSSVETGNSDELSREIIRRLVFRGALEKRPIRIEELFMDLGQNRAAEIRETVRRLSKDASCPVEMLGSGPHANVYLTDYRDAKEYLDAA